MINENVRRYFFDSLFNIHFPGTGQNSVKNRDNIPAYPEEAGIYSLVISEIMADPHPVVALPDAEYLEIYNRGPSPVSLAGYRLLFGDKLRILTPRRDGRRVARTRRICNRLRRG